MPSTLLRNAYALYALQIANYVIPLLTLPYLVRHLGAQAYGWLAFAAAVNFYFVLCVDAGMNTYASRELSRLDPQRNAAKIHEAGALVLHVTALKAMLLSACGLLLWLCIALIPSWQAQSALFAWCFLTVAGSVLFPTWLFQGLQTMHHTLFCGVAGRLLATGGIFLWVKGPEDLLWAAALQSSATLLSGLLALPVILTLPSLQWSWPHWQGVREVARHSRRLAVSEYAKTALANSTVFLLGMVQSKEVVGIYAAIEKTLRAAASLFMPLIQAAQPRVVQRWHQPSPQGIPQHLQAWSWRLLLLSWVCAALGYLFSEWGLQILFDQATAGHAHWARILCAWLPFYVANAMLGSWWWIASGRENGYAKRTLPGVVLQAGMFAAALWTGSPELALWVWVLGECCMTGLLAHQSGIFSARAIRS